MSKLQDPRSATLNGTEVCGGVVRARTLRHPQNHIEWHGGIAESCLCPKFGRREKQTKWPRDFRKAICVQTWGLTKPILHGSEAVCVTTWGLTKPILNVSDSVCVQTWGSHKINPEWLRGRLCSKCGTNKTNREWHGRILQFVPPTPLAPERVHPPEPLPSSL